MKIESARRKSLKIAVLCAVAFALPTASIALPRQGAGHACSCMCNVTLGNGRNVGLPANFNLPAGINCMSAEAMTCNVSDPATGGVRQGNLQACGDGSLHLTVKRLGPPVTNPMSNAPNR